jgi:hypothetical protein
MNLVNSSTTVRPPGVAAKDHRLPLHGDILGPEDSVHLSVAPHPLRTQYKAEYVPEGASLLEMLKQAQPDPFLRRYAHILVNGEVIPEQWWDRVRPKSGTSVTIRTLPQGGGGGGKGPLRIILMIVIIIVAIYTGGAALAAAQAAGWSSMAAAGAQALASAAVMAIGGMLVNAIAPPPKPKMPERNSSAGFQNDSPTLFIAGTRNEFRGFSPIPRVLGRSRFRPPYGAKPFSESLADSQYIRLIFCYGYGPLKIEDERISTTSLDEFEGVETEFRRGYQTAQITNKGTWSAATSYPANPAFGDRWTVSASGTASGASYVVGDTITYCGMDEDDRYAHLGWDKNAGHDLSLYPDDVNEEALNILLTQAGGNQLVTSAADADEISVDFTFANGLATFTENGAKTNYSVTIVVESSPAGANTWTTRSTLVTTAATTAAVRNGVRWQTEARGSYDVRVRRITADDDSSNILDDVYWTALRTFTNEDPISKEGMCLVAMRIKATDQLNGVVESYNAIAQSILMEYQPASGTFSGTWSIAATSQPSAMIRDVLCGVGNARAIDFATRIHAESLINFDAWCRSKGYEFNMIRDFVASVPETLADITASGRGSMSIIDGKWGVVFDGPQTVPVQKFTPRNTWGFQGIKSFPVIPHAFRVPFVNRDKDWAIDERIVYSDGYSVDGSGGTQRAVTFEQIELPGVTDADTVWKLARFHIAQLILRPEEYSFQTDFEWLVAQRGSLCKLQHDVLIAGICAGRIKSITTDGSGNATAITVDETCDMEDGVVYGISIRTVSNIALTRQIASNPGSQTSLTFTTPIPAASIPTVGDLFAFGELGEETIDVVIKSIEPQSDLAARIICVDYAAGVQTADTGPIPTFVSNVSSVPELNYPAVTGIRSDESVLVVLPDNTWSPRIDVSLGFSARRALTVTGIQFRYRLRDSQGTWQYAAGDRDASNIFLTDVEQGSTYEFQGRYQTATDFGHWGPLLYHTVIGASTPPDDVDELLRQGDYAIWPGYSPPPDILGYRVRHLPGSTVNWTAGINALPLNEDYLTVSQFDLRLLPPGTRVLMVKAIDLAGNESVNPVSLILNLGDIPTPDELQTRDLVALGYPYSATDLPGWYNGTISGGFLTAKDDGGLYLPNGMDLYLTNGTASYLPVSFLEMQYTYSFVFDQDFYPCDIVLQPTGTGPWLLEYRKGNDQAYINGESGTASYLPNGTASYLPYGFDGAFVSWPGSIPADPNFDIYQFRWTFFAGSIESQLTVAEIILNGIVEEEILEDVVIASDGTTRLSLARTYRSIKLVNMTLQPGHTAVRLEIADKDADLGPLIKAYNAAGSLTTALIDAHVWGLKG